MKIDINNFLKEQVVSNDSVDPTLPEEIFPLIKSFLDRFEPLSTSPTKFSERWQDEYILKIIPEKARVLDLGCADGKLLKYLITEKNIFGQGVDLDQENILRAIENNVPVFHADIESELSIFQEHSFDYVILEETLQTLKNPLATLKEMLRIGRRGIISFPNFGYWKVRLDLLIRGKMPVAHSLPYRWYDTPNIHLFTYNDFVEMLDEFNCYVEVGYALMNNEVIEINDKCNLESEELLLVIHKN